MRRTVCALLCMIMMALPVSSGKETKYVALTFDDGPSGRFTRRLLEGLEERDVKATFFLCGYRLADYKTLAKKIYGQGHEIGLHGYSHENLGKMTAAQVRKELKDTAARWPEGCEVTLLRPRGGATGQALTQVCRRWVLPSSTGR